MKKLAIIYPWFADYRQPVLEALAKELRGEFEITLISDTVATEPAMKMIEPTDLTVKHDPPLRWEFVKNITIRKFLWQVGVVWKMLTRRFDAVIFLGEFRNLSSWIGIVIARLRFGQAYFWTHGVYGNEGWLKLKLRLLYYRPARGIFLYGNYAKGLMLQHGFQADRLWVVFNSLDHQQQLQIRNAFQEPEVVDDTSSFFSAHSDCPQLTFIGRLTMRKQVPVLLHALKILRDRGVVVNSLLVGDGPELSSLQNDVRSLEMEDQVHFFGACHDETRLAHLIRKSAVCVSPGDIGLLAMHSMVYGTPVVTHDDPTTHGPEFESIVAGQTGSFFKKDDPESLADEISYWVSLDEKKRETVRQKCYHVVDQFFTPEFQSQVFAEVLRGELPDEQRVELN